MSDSFKSYPRGAIAMGGGDLMQVTNVKIDTGNGGKIKHTLRKRGAGAVLGNEETTVSFDFEVDEDGQEREYLKMVKKGQIKQLRIKIPGETITVNGIFTKRTLDLPLDDAIKGTMEFLGTTEDP